VGKVRDSGTPPPYLPARTARPSPEDQVRFIANIERILSEGSFVATYKYALLVALVELAIERGDDSNRELALPIRDIADKFAELYWRQAAPYEADRVSGLALVLHQNKGKQAGAITRLARLRDELKGSRSTLAEARRTAEWKRLVGQMQSLLKTMPLWRLQRVGHEDIRFLYEPGPGADHITLLPGVACHLRERAPLIRRLAQTEWLRFVLLDSTGGASTASAVCRQRPRSITSSRGHVTRATSRTTSCWPTAPATPARATCWAARSISGAGRGSSRITMPTCSRSAPRRACSSIARSLLRWRSGAMGTPSACRPRCGSAGASTGTGRRSGGECWGTERRD